MPKTKLDEILSKLNNSLSNFERMVNGVVKEASYGNPPHPGDSLSPSQLKSQALYRQEWFQHIYPGSWNSVGTRIIQAIRQEGHRLGLSNRTIEDAIQSAKEEIENNR